MYEDDDLEGDSAEVAAQRMTNREAGETIFLHVQQHAYLKLFADLVKLYDGPSHPFRWSFLY